MPVIQIDYDLNENKDYDRLIAKIKGLGGWAHVLKSCWLVAGASLTVESVFDVCRSVMDTDDHVLVTYFRKPYRGWLPKDIHTWIEQHAT